MAVNVSMSTPVRQTQLTVSLDGEAEGTRHRLLVWRKKHASGHDGLRAVFEGMLCERFIIFDTRAGVKKLWCAKEGRQTSMQRKRREGKKRAALEAYFKDKALFAGPHQF